MDTDLDGLADYEEIKFISASGQSLIDDSDPKNVKLLNFAEVLELSGDRYNYLNDGSKHFYVKDGLKRFTDEYGEDVVNDFLLNVRILPINSDPTNEDGDLDNVCDKDDFKPLSYGVGINYFLVYENSENKNGFTEQANAMIQSNFSHDHNIVQTVTCCEDLFE